MNDDALQWLTERAAQPGTLACALRGPDGQCLSHSMDQTCPTTTIEGILANFDALADRAEPAAPLWSTWVFEQGRIRLMERPDGCRLALVVLSDSAAVEALDSISQEFLTASFDSQGV
jgi:hypothetical protein